MVDMDENTGGLGTFAIGLCCGAIVGAALALMYAPKSGVQMRQDITDRTERLRRRANEQADWMRRRANDLYSGASETFNQVVERGRGAIEVGREAYRKARPHDGPAHDMPNVP